MERFKCPIGVFLLLMKNGKIYLQLRKNCSFSGMYGAIGGHVDGGETITNAVMREAKEEVGIDIQTSHIIVFQRALLIHITYGEVVVSHSVTTFYVDTIVLSHGCMIHIVLPVSVLVVLCVVIVGGILVEELERTVTGVGRLQQLRGIASVLLSIHHIDELRLEYHTDRCVGCDTSRHRFTTVCLNDNDAVGTLGTIKSSTVTHHSHLFNVGRIQCRQNIVEESLVQHGAALLLVDDDIVDDDQRLGIDIE